VRTVTICHPWSEPQPCHKFPLRRWLSAALQTDTRGALQECPQIKITKSQPAAKRSHRDKETPKARDEGSSGSLGFPYLIRALRAYDSPRAAVRLARDGHNRPF